MKTIEKLFGASDAVISLTTLITTVAGFLDLSLPRWAVWAIGIVNMISLPLLIYSTVKSLRDKARATREAARKAAGKAVAVKAGDIAKLAAGESGAAEPKAEGPVKVRPKPHPQQLAAKKAASGNRPKKGKKKKK